MEYEYKTITNIPGWVNLLKSSDKVTSPAKSYGLVPLVFRGVRLRSDALAGAPLKVYSGEQEVEWPFEADPYDLIWNTQASLMLAGCSYWLKQRSSSRLLDVQWLNPYSIEPDLEDGQIVFRSRLEQGKTYTQDDIAYFREWNITSDVKPGPSPVSVGLSDAKLSRWITEFASAFFEGGGMPITLVSMQSDTPVPRSEVKRVEHFFKRFASGVQNAFRVLGVRAGVTAEVITPPFKEMAMEKLDNKAIKGLAWALEIPLTMLLDAANYATAKEHRLGFYTDTVRPAGTKVEGVINRQFLEGTGLTAKFAWEEMDIFQEDEKERSGAFLNYRNGGVPVGLALQIVGVDLPEGYEYDDLDEEEETQEEEEGGQSDDREQRDDDLKKWQKKAISRVKAGRPAACDFYSDVLPDTAYRLVWDGLSHAHTVGEVRKVFDLALRSDMFVPGEGVSYQFQDGDAEITEPDLDEAVALWDELMPAYDGMLAAEVIEGGEKRLKGGGDEDEDEDKPSWVWNKKAKRYQSSTGQFVSYSDAVGLRDSFIQAQKAKAKELAQALTNGEITLSQWVTEQKRLMKSTYIDMYALGKGGRNNLTQADYGSIGHMMKGQYQYLEGFVDDINSGLLTAGQIGARSGLYVEGASQAFEKAKAREYGITLPQYPGDGNTQCLTNCQCSWVIDDGEESVRATWTLGPADHCPDCLDNAERWAPLEVVKG